MATTNYIHLRQGFGGWFPSGLRPPPPSTLYRLPSTVQPPTSNLQRPLSNVYPLPSIPYNTVSQ